LVSGRNNETAVGVLSWFTTPGFFLRLRYILESLFPGPTYLKEYFGPAPWGFWPLLYFRRVTVIMQKQLPNAK